MFKVRVSISALMMVVVLFALEFAALRSGSQLWLSVVYTFTALLILFAVVASKYGRRETRAFWFGFAVFGWGYLLLALGPWTTLGEHDSNSNLLTTDWIETSLHWIRGQAPESGYGNPVRRESDDITEFAKNTTGFAHLMVTLALALLGGWIAAVLRRRRTKPRDTGTGRSKSRISIVSHALIGLVFSVLLGSAAYDYARPVVKYFPGMAFDENKGLNQFIVHWYSKHLKAMNEPSLLKLAQTNRAATVYRLLWLPSFHHPAMIRLVKTGDAATLRLVILDGSGGYEPGQFAIDRTIKITPEQWKELEKGIVRMKFWTVRTSPDKEGAEDGAQVILEGVQDGQYHLIDRQQPDPEYLALCQSIIDLSQFPSLRRAFDDYHAERNR